MGALSDTGWRFKLFSSLTIPAASELREISRIASTLEHLGSIPSAGQGDLVKADLPKGQYPGQYTGRIAIRYRPSFVLQTSEKKFDVHLKYLQTIFRADGYEYKVN